MGSSEATTYIATIGAKSMEKAVDYFKEYVLVWLDTAIASDKKVLSISLGLLETIQTVQTFNDVEECMRYLKSNTEKRVFLVLSCPIDETVLSEWLETSHIEYVYRFGEEMIIKKEQSRLIQVTNIEELYRRLSNDMRSTMSEDDTDFAYLAADATTKKVLETDEDARIFVLYQFLIEILLRLPRRPDMRDQFMEFCLKSTADNATQQKMFLESMQDYTPEKAIYFYTRPLFLHRLLNRTCRLGDIKSMFKLAFYMTDLYDQVNKLHIEYSELYHDHIVVYRGRRLSAADYEKLKSSIGDLVVTKSFLSTTTDREVAKIYAGADSSTADSDHLSHVPVIFVMRIDTRRNESKPFAYVRYQSAVRSDNEVLLSIGTVFRLTEEKKQNGICEFRLIRTSQEEQVEMEIKDVFSRNSTTELAIQEIVSNPSIDVQRGLEELVDTLHAPIASHKKQVAPEKQVEMKPTVHPGTIQSADTLDSFLSRVLLRNCKRIWKELIELKTDSKHLFQFESNMKEFDEDDFLDRFLSSPNGSELVIRGKMLPSKEPYRQRSFPIEFYFPSHYPMEPPRLRFLVRLFHPHIQPDGSVCAKTLDEYGSYRPSMSLTELLHEMDQLLSTPTVLDDYFVNWEAAQKYMNDRASYEKKALEFVLKYGHPRP